MCLERGVRPIRFVAVLAVAVLGVGVAALLGAFDDEKAEARAVADRYAKALTSGSGDQLAAVACRRPTPRQLAAFESMAQDSMLSWSVLAEPEVADDVARATLRAVEGDRHQDYPISLHLRDGSWCANYNWSTLATPG